MNKHNYRIIVLAWVAMASIALTGCGKESDKSVTAQQAAPASEAQTTVVTDENYGQAESEIIIAGYIQQIAAATGTDGMGVWMHLREGADPKDRTVMRINFDTLYSFAIVDLTEDAVLTMPETNGRYQSAWFVTDEHYNPMAIVEPGTYTLTQEDVGSRYAMIAIRTQVNVADPADLAIVHEIQDRLKLEQKDKGAFVPSADWDMEEVLAMRAKYQEIGKAEGITSEQMFGKKGEVPLKEHNVGTASGWGGLTAERAVYPSIYAESVEPQTLTLRDVPTEAFWSVTVYDAEGYPQGDVYNINSAFAVPEDDGSFVIRFGGDKGAVNYMDIYEGWNLALRIYEPTEAYFNGEWVMPELAANVETAVVPVTIDNFIRAATDIELDKYVSLAGGVNRFYHFREPAPVDNQPTIRMNRDTLYSTAVVDISEGATLTLPEAGERYMTAMIVNQDHFINEVFAGGGTYTLDMETFDTPYVIVYVRTLVDAADAGDVDAVNALQDEMTVAAASSKPFIVPNYDKDRYEALVSTLLPLGAFVGSGSTGTFGAKENINPVRHLLGTALGWGGLPENETVYEHVEPGLPPGQYKIEVPSDVPVGAFWSISLYNAKGFFEPNDRNAYNVNSVTGTRNDDGSMTVHFGGCEDDRVNCLPVMENWNYIIRMYRPGEEVLKEEWVFPAVEPVQ